MNDYVGIIKLFAGNYAPVGWRFCDGTVLIIGEYQALFNAIGAVYGGDGKVTFAVPDLRSLVPVGAKTKVGTIPLGQSGGETAVTLTSNQSGHTHNLMVSNQPGTKQNPGPNSSVGAPNLAITGYKLFAQATPNVQLNSVVLTPWGESNAHNNMMPYLGLNYIICDGTNS